MGDGEGEVVHIRGMRESMEVLGSSLPVHANRSTGNCRLPASPICLSPGGCCVRWFWFGFCEIAHKASWLPRDHKDWLLERVLFLLFLFRS
jgi:hypothetical protein